VKSACGDESVRCVTGRGTVPCKQHEASRNLALSRPRPNPHRERAQSTTNQFATLLFPFEANFVPRKCRKPRQGLFMGSDVVELPEAAPGEAVPAFRSCDAPLDHLDSFEILAFDDKCWWPLTGIPPRDDD
jgi:hypothetical protein